MDEESLCAGVERADVKANADQAMAMPVRNIIYDPDFWEALREVVRILEPIDEAQITL